MEKAKNVRRIFLIAGAVSCVISVVTMALVVVLWYKTLYVFMGVILALSIASIYRPKCLWFSERKIRFPKHLCHSLFRGSSSEQ